MHFPKITPKTIATIVITSGLIFFAAADCFAYTAVVAFGDSLTDNDDLDGYGSSIASNGPKVWIDYVAEAYGEDILLEADMEKRR